jgi:hypothetical protein
MKLVNICEVLDIKTPTIIIFLEYKNIMSIFGYGNHDMYFETLNQITRIIRFGTFANIIDWGSDAGFISTKVAHLRSGCFIISVDNYIMDNQNAYERHLKEIKRNRLFNNTIVKTLFDGDTFKRLKKYPVKYQFVLNIFHWLGDGKKFTQEQWDQLFIDLIKCAKYTFFEIPNSYSDTETRRKIGTWYGDNDEIETLNRVKQQYKLKFEFEELAEINHKRKGFRKLFLITNKFIKSYGMREKIIDKIENKM